MFLLVHMMAVDNYYILYAHWLSTGYIEMNLSAISTKMQSLLSWNSISKSCLQNIGQLCPEAKKHGKKVLFAFQKS